MKVKYVGIVLGEQLAKARTSGSWIGQEARSSDKLVKAGTSGPKLGLLSEFGAIEARAIEARASENFSFLLCARAPQAKICQRLAGTGKF